MSKSVYANVYQPHLKALLGRIYRLERLKLYDLSFCSLQFTESEAIVYVSSSGIILCILFCVY